MTLYCYSVKPVSQEEVFRNLGNYIKTLFFYEDENRFCLKLTSEAAQNLFLNENFMLI